MVSIQKTKDEFLAYLRYSRKLAEPSIRTYGYALQLFQKYGLRQGITEVEQITRDAFQRYQNEQQSTGQLGSATIRARGISVNLLLKFCCSMGYLPRNPLDGFQLPRKEHKLPNIFSATEEDLFLQTPVHNRKNPERAKRDTLVLQFMIIGAFRFGEVQNLRVQDLDLDRQSVRIIGKGAKQRYNPLHPILQKSAREYISVRPRVKHDFLFVSNNGRSRLGKTGLYQIFRKHLRRCGISRPGLTPHSARHSAATRILRRSLNLVAVQKYLGHESLETTSIYLHFNDADVRKAVEMSF